MKTKAALAVLLAAAAFLPACGQRRSYEGRIYEHDPAAEVAAQQRQYAQDLALAECQVNIEVFLPGMRPARPFRVLGPIEGNWGWTVESRFTRMKKKACELGASAILDAGERYETVGGTTTRFVHYDSFGRPVIVVEQPRQTVRRTSAIAIVYTDSAPASASGVVYSNGPN